MQDIAGRLRVAQKATPPELGAVVVGVGVGRAGVGAGVGVAAGVGAGMIPSLVGVVEVAAVVGVTAVPEVG